VKTANQRLQSLTAFSFTLALVTTAFLAHRFVFSTLFFTLTLVPTTQPIAVILTTPLLSLALRFAPSLPVSTVDSISRGNNHGLTPIDLSGGCNVNLKCRSQQSYHRDDSQCTHESQFQKHHLFVNPFVATAP